MSDFILSCCSTADLSAEHFAARNIKYICFHFEVDGKNMPDDLGQSVPFKEFYQMMRDGAMTKTSQVGVGEYEDFFEGFLKEGLDILHVALSSGISGTFNSAVLAAQDLRERYPDRKIYIIDSLASSSGLCLLMYEVVDFRDAVIGRVELRADVEISEMRDRI